MSEETAGGRAVYVDSAVFLKILTTNYRQFAKKRRTKFKITDLI